MTFDDGIVEIYNVVNTASAGNKPIRGLSLAESFYFGYDTLGINRYYTALQAHQQIEAVINVPGWNTIQVETVAIIDGAQFKVQMVQPMHDEFGLRITKLSLERLGENYAIVS